MPADWREIEDESEKCQYYLCSREWSVLKEAVHKRAQGVCERCGQSTLTKKLRNNVIRATQLLALR